MRELTLSVRNFRGVRYAEWSPDGVVLLAGPNGSGKSTLLEAFSFLRSYLLYDLDGALNEIGTSGLRHLKAPTREPITIALQLGEVSWQVQIAVDGNSVASNPGEVLKIGDREIFRRALFATVWYLNTSWRNSGSGKCCLRMAQEQELLDRRAVDPLIELVQSIRYYRSYDLQALRREPEPASGRDDLDASDRNLYAVLRSWRSAPLRSEGRFEWVMEHLRAAFPDAIRHVEFDEIGQQVRARFYPVDSTRADQSLPMHRASDGLLVGLLHLTAVAGTKPGALIAIDAMENQLHPHAIRTLLDAMRELCLHRSGGSVRVGKSRVVDAIWRPTLPQRASPRPQDAKRAGSTTRHEASRLALDRLARIGSCSTHRRSAPAGAGRRARPGWTPAGASRSGSHTSPAARAP